MRRLWALLAGNRDYRLLVSANVVSSTGDWILRTGLTYQIYALTGSTTASAAAVLAALLPHIALGSMAGVYVDRWERRRTIIVANLLLGAGLLPLLFVRGPETAWIIYLVLATQSCLALFFATAEAALVPSLVPEKDLVTANSVNGQARDVARLTGAALGGVVVALGGIALLTIVDVVTFAVAAALLASMRRPGASAPVRARRRHLLREWADGLRIVRSSRTLKTILVFTVITGMGEAVMSTLMAPFVHDVLHGSARTYGAIMSAQAIGGIFGGLLTTIFGHRFAPRRLLGYGAVAFGALDLALFLYPLLTRSPWPALALMAAVGLPGALTIAGLMTVFQTATHDSHRGRVFGTLVALEASAMLASTVAAGTLGDRLGIMPVLAVQGVGYCAAGLLVLILLPEPEPEPEPEPQPQPSSSTQAPGSGPRARATTSGLHGRDGPTRRATVVPSDCACSDRGRGVATVTTKITLIYDNPQDPDTFEAGYPDQLALARKIPGIQRMETSKVWPKEDGSPTPAYRLVDLYFADYDAASAAVTTAEAGAFFPSVFELATGGVRIVFADVEQS